MANDEWGGDDWSGVESKGRQNYGKEAQARDTRDAGDLASGRGDRVDLAQQFRDAFRRSGATDAEISSSLADLGFGYGTRANLLGPLDAIAATSPWSRFASIFASGLTQLTPFGRAVTLGDILQRGLTTGLNTALNNQSPMGALGFGGLPGFTGLRGLGGGGALTVGGSAAPGASPTPQADHGYEFARLPSWMLQPRQPGGRVF